MAVTTQRKNCQLYYREEAFERCPQHMSQSLTFEVSSCPVDVLPISARVQVLGLRMGTMKLGRETAMY